MSGALGRDPVDFERLTGFRTQALRQAPPNESHAAYWVTYPITLLKCVSMALVCMFLYFVLRIYYSSWWYPDKSRVKPPRLVKQKLDPEEALNAMQTLERIAADCQARVFWISGTLLGLERIGRPLPHDNDLDIGICTDDPHCLDFIRALWASNDVVELKPQRISQWIKIQNPDLQHIPHCIIRYKAAVRSSTGAHRPGVKVDIFLHFPYCGGLMHGTRNSLWLNSPLNVAQKRYGQRSFSVPEDPHRYLTENYGDYRIEVKEFENSIDCPNAMNIFSWTSLGYLASRLQMMLKLGRVDRARQINARIRATIRKGLSPFDARRFRSPGT